MKFRTELELQPAKFSLDHSMPILSLGSCFADRIGNRLLENKFTCQVNPFGVIFNPVSLLNLLDSALAGSSRKPQKLFQQRGLWHSFDFHSDFSHPDRDLVAQSMADCLDFVGDFLRKTDVLILTLGTARVYRNCESGELVANCHKVPQLQFEPELLNPDTILAHLTGFLASWRRVNPYGKVILTVSPVRHTRDGLAQNAVSKSILRYACELACQNLEAVYYFPAYELVLDDLRDYRFFEPDLVHPNRMALDYVWEKFRKSYFSGSTSSLIDRWAKLKAGIDHQPFHAESAEHKAFLLDLLVKLEKLSEEMDLREEIGEIQGRLA